MRYLFLTFSIIAMVFCSSCVPSVQTNDEQSKVKITVERPIDVQVTREEKTKTAVTVATPTILSTPFLTPLSMESDIPEPMPNPTKVPVVLLPTATLAPTPEPIFTRFPNLAALPTHEAQLSYSVIVHEQFLDELGWAVGENGYVAYWDGKQWVQISTPATDTLNKVAIFSHDNAVAVGDGTQVLHWDGIQWHLIYSFNNLPYYDHILSDVVYTSATEIWAVGFVNSEQAGSPIVLRLQWDGQTWNEVDYGALPGACDCVLESILMLAPNDGWIVGFKNVSAFIMHWDGTQWVEVPNPYGNEYPGAWLYSISGTSSDNLLATGIVNLEHSSRSRRLELHWDGTEWTDISK